MGKFGKLILALEEENCHVIHLKQVRLSDIKEQYRDATILGKTTGAELPAQARGSIDDRLRGDDELQLKARRNFTSLEELLCEGQ